MPEARKLMKAQMITLLLLLLSCFSRVRLCVTPYIAAHQAPPSLGFSRQEHWSGLPFPSPLHESEKWKWSCSVVSDSATPWTAAYQAPLSMGFSRQEYWSGVPPDLQRLSHSLPLFRPLEGWNRFTDIAPLSRWHAQHLSISVSSSKNHNGYNRSIHW